MIVNRELGLDDYLAITRRRLGLVLVPLLICTLLGFLVSFILTPKYTSRSLLLVEDQMVPAGYVKPIVTERVSDRMTILTQNVLSRTRLQALVTSGGDRLAIMELTEELMDICRLTQRSYLEMFDTRNSAMQDVASGEAVCH